jgi:hypothetical protein
VIFSIAESALGAALRRRLVALHATGLTDLVGLEGELDHAVTALECHRSANCTMSVAAMRFASKIQMKIRLERPSANALLLAPLVRLR